MRAQIALLVGSALLISSLMGCSSSAEVRDDERDSGPDEIVGAPPEEGSEDYEFAPPPSHPGMPETSQAEEPMAEFDAESDVIDAHYIRQLKSYGPAMVLQHVHTEPVHEDDEFVGFEIVELSAKARHYVEPRLQVGDVITHVNLVRLEKPDDYMEAWETLDETGEVRIDMIRNGESADVIWSVE